MNSDFCSWLENVVQKYAVPDHQLRSKTYPAIKGNFVSLWRLSFDGNLPFAHPES